MFSVSQILAKLIIASEFIIILLFDIYFSQLFIFIFMFFFIFHKYIL